MNQIAMAAKTALQSCPQTSWKAQPVYDHSDQRLSVESMMSQLVDQSQRARAKVFVMLVDWAQTGKWPQFRNDPVYFVRDILNWWAGKENFRPFDDFPTDPPPWQPKYAAMFLDQTALSWYLIERDKWARRIAEEAFDMQESMFRSQHPIE